MSSTCGKKAKIMKPIYKTLNETMKNEDKDTKRINIFLDKQDYKSLLDLKYKYRLSFGYIVRIIADNYFVLEPLKQKCMEEQYYNTRTMRKTSLKIPSYQANRKYKYYNNAVIMYLKKYDKLYVEDKIYQKVRNLIANEFENTIDPLWEWDKYARYNYRMEKIKENQ